MAAEGVAGRVVIVTGGGGGIGRGLVRHLGSQGAKVVVAELDDERRDSAVAELESRGAEALGVRTDVMQRDSIEAMVAETAERFGRLDGLVNNALVQTPQRPLAEVTDEDMDVNFTSHVRATLWGMQAVYPHMKRAGWGRIVNVGSSAGLVSFKGFGAYGMAKEAVRSLTRTAAREWAEDGIVVNCYCPVSMIHYYASGVEIPRDGYVGMSVAVLESLLPAGTPQTVGDPETDLGPAVAFLLSDGSRYLTGQTVTLDGGSYAFA
jgi:NAD(P)-dependent dehydrogenase (short-subunit alcohol dehydrogenase family)